MCIQLRIVGMALCHLPISAVSPQMGNGLSAAVCEVLVEHDPVAENTERIALLSEQLINLVEARAVAATKNMYCWRFLSASSSAITS